ncbi:MAG: tRNA-intron lyase [Candidatus Nanoarchaeia archaeon]|jgi:tRNA-intron endonuclease
MPGKLRLRKLKSGSDSWLQGDKVVISADMSVLQSIRDRGNFGTIVNSNLELSLCEALYLVERGKIEVFDKSKRALSVNGFARKAKEFNPRFWVRYKVYSDIRAKGYVTKAALKYGADFSVYDRGGAPETAHSRWLLFAVSADDSFSWREFSAMNRVAHSVKKELLIGVVDGHSDVTYYGVNWVRP